MVDVCQCVPLPHSMIRMIFRLCCCCFGFGKDSPSDVKKLLTKSSNARQVSQQQPQEIYTVHKISSFGRAVSHDDDGAHSDYEAATEKNYAVINKNNALWSSRPVLVQPGGSENEALSDIEDSSNRSPQASPIIKKKGHWGKVRLKAKRETTTKNPQSFQSLASVSMMMLPTITVAGSSTSLADNTEDSGSRNELSVASIKKEREVRSLTSSPQPPNTWMKSQSMMNVNCISDDLDTSTERVPDDVAKKYGLDTSLYNNLHISKSTEAINRVWKSMEDFVNDKGFVDLANGTVHFQATYNKTNRKLQVRFDKIEGLAPKGADRKKYDCIIKLTLLPHEKHIKFSKAIPAHSTLDIDESFILSVKDPTKKVLRISVYDTEYLGKYDAVGHALFYLEDVLNDEQKSHIMKLYRQSIPDIQAGSIKIALNYNRETEVLSMVIEEAHNLPIFSGKCKSYIKLTQHTLGRKTKELYSPYVSAHREVLYNFPVDLKIESNSLHNSFVVVSVKLRGFLKKDVLIGRVIFGPFLYSEYGKSLTPWGRAILNNELVSHVFRMYL